MRRMITMVGMAALIVALSATSAFAKGPSAATIDGPGTGGGIDVDGKPGSGEPGSGGTLSQFADHTGLFAIGLGEGVGKLTTEQPDGALGPELTVTWTVPGPDGTDTVVQRLYPYADAGAVTYTDAGQAFIGMETLGGWYVGGEPLSATLTDLGVPEQAPSQRPPLAPIVAGITIVGALSLVLMLTRRAARHRREPIDALAHP